MVSFKKPESYLDNPKIPENVPFFWYILSAVLIVVMIVSMLYAYTRPRNINPTTSTIQSP